MRTFPTQDDVPPPSSDPLTGRLPLVFGGSLALALALGAMLTRGLWSNRR
jgi:hypothetical protein